MYNHNVRRSSLMKNNWPQFSSLWFKQQRQSTFREMHCPSVMFLAVALSWRAIRNWLISVNVPKANETLKTMNTLASTAVQLHKLHEHDIIKECPIFFPNPPFPGPRGWADSYHHTFLSEPVEKTLFRTPLIFCESLWKRIPTCNSCLPRILIHRGDWNKNGISQAYYID